MFIIGLRNFLKNVFLVQTITFINVAFLESGI